MHILRQAIYLTPSVMFSLCMSLPLPCHDLTFYSQADWSCVYKVAKACHLVFIIYMAGCLYYAWLTVHSYTNSHSTDAWPDATVLIDCERSEFRHHKELQTPTRVCFHVKCDGLFLKGVLLMSVWWWWLIGVFMLFHVLCKHIDFYKRGQ